MEAKSLSLALLAFCLLSLTGGSNSATAGPNSRPRSTIAAQFLTIRFGPAAPDKQVARASRCILKS